MHLRDLRADQIGSLLRPDFLREAYVRYEAGEMDAARLRAIQDEAIGLAVAAQQAHGAGVVTDGEFRRLSFQDSFGAAVSGFDAQTNTVSFTEKRAEGGSAQRRWDPGYTGRGPVIVHRRPVVERLRLVRNVLLEEYAFVAKIARRPAKVTLIGPDRILQRFDHEGSSSVYADPQEFADDVVHIQQRMVQELVDFGCPYVQIDEPGYTAYVDQASLAQMRARGEDPKANMTRSITANNRIVESFPNMTFGVHLCRGNQRSMWHREGSYDAVAEQLFNELGHHRLLLEYDSERAGSFEALRFVPRGKVIVLGLVSTKTPALEDPEALKRRIDQASSYLELDQLALSPQCGFASSLPGNRLSHDDQWRKLDLVHKVAADVWGQ